MKKLILLFFSALFFSSLLFSQDVHFSLPYSSPLNLNPAFAGSSGCARTIAGYRTQWVGFPGAPKTFFASYDQYVKSLRGGVGLNYYNDRIGNFMANQIDVIYSAHIPLFKGRYVFKPAAEVSYVSRRIEWNQLNFGPGSFGFIYSPPAPSKHTNFFDLSFGTLLYSERIFIGTAFHHVTEPNEGSWGGSHLPVKYTLHAGGNIGRVGAAKAFIVTPSFLFVQQEDFREFAMSCKAGYDKFSLGIGYRNSNALILSAGFQYDRIRIGYGYDVTISELGIVAAGLHEIVIGLAFNCKNNATEKLFLNNTPF